MTSKRRANRPGPGWRHLGGAVWEHDCGVRIHIYGLCRSSRGPFVNGRMWPESRNLDRMIQINGGNRKRGVMAWALKASEEKP